MLEQDQRRILQSIANGADADIDISQELGIGIDKVRDLLNELERADYIQQRKNYNSDKEIIQRKIVITSEGLSTLREYLLNKGNDNTTTTTINYDLRGATIGGGIAGRDYTGDVAKVKEEIEMIKQQIDDLNKEKGFYEDKVISYEEQIKRLEFEKSKLELRLRSSDDRFKKAKELQKALIEFGEEMTASHQAESWLSDSRQKALAIEAAEYGLRKYCESKQISENEVLDSTKQLAEDIKDCLYLIQHCLSLGDYNLLHRAIIEAIIPLNLDAQLYVTAFEFIKEYRIFQELPIKEAKNLEFYLDYMIVNIRLL